MNNDRIEYTLPGVMHYLQQQFTKNERDRISWELERSEMKNRIRQLENEIRQLKRDKLMHQMSSKNSNAFMDNGGPTENNLMSGKNVSDDTSNVDDLDSQSLNKFTNSQEKVRENVREIIYLLNGPNVNSNLQTIADRSSHLHQLDYLNINQLSLSESRNTDHSTNNINDSNIYKDNVIRDEKKITLDPTTNKDKLNIHGNDYDDDKVEMTQDINTTDKDIESDTTIADTFDEAVSELDNNEQITVEEIDDTNNSNVNDKINDLKLTEAKQIVEDNHEKDVKPCIIDCISNKILTLFDNKLVYYILQEDDFSLQEMNSNFDSLNMDNLKYISWLNSHSIITLNDQGIKIFDSISGKLLNSFNPFNDTLQFDEIKSCNFKNKWFLISTTHLITILEFNMDEPFEIMTTYQVKVNNIKNALLGITEKSFITVLNNPLKLIIYNFTGETLQTINLNKEISKKRLTNDIKLFLNKDTSKLLIQLKRHLVVYSFEQKRSIFQITLPNEPAHISFKYDEDLIGLGYLDGSVDWRELNNFKSYYNYQHSNMKLNNFTIDATKLANTIKFISLDQSGLKIGNID